MGALEMVIIVVAMMLLLLAKQQGQELEARGQKGV